MLRVVSLSMIACLSMFYSVHAETATDKAQEAKGANDSDMRQLVSMPEQARRLMQQDMLDHLAALNEIIGHLATGELVTAAEVAESRMGKSAMGKHRATGMGPGRFMPLAMRNLGWGMHESASEFSRIAKTGDVKAAYNALQKVTASCVACHYSYRTR